MCFFLHDLLSDDCQSGGGQLEGTSLSWASIETGCHQMFSVGGCPDIEIDDGWDMIEAYALAFSRHHLLADESEESIGLLNGSLQPWTQISIQSK